MKKNTTTLWQPGIPDTNATILFHKCIPRWTYGN
uniref:Uncharacterized protein n=1 Tax=Arundo donax TaxID=35708 RepID=A0A0A9H618_ARUDO